MHVFTDGNNFMRTPIGLRTFLASTLLGVLFILMIVGCGRTPPGAASSPRGTPIRIAAASSLRFALPEIIGAYEKAHAPAKAEATYAASGSLAAQIASKAPFDVFLAADEKYPQELIKAAHGVDGSYLRYATGRLALWVPAGSPLDVGTGLACLEHESVKKIALANPALAPYGVAAEETLKNAGVYDTLRDKLVLGENIAQAAQFVESGAAQAGFVALSLAMSPAMKDKGTYWLVPETDHTPIMQGGCVSVYAADMAAAQRFMTFLRGEDARAILRRHGFGIPGE